jgi:hypothetical protein
VSASVLASAEKRKGSALTDDEIEEVMQSILWWILAMANGMDANMPANAMRAEAEGLCTTVH